MPNPQQSLTPSEAQAALIGLYVWVQQQLLLAATRIMRGGGDLATVRTRMRSITAQLNRELTIRTPTMVLAAVSSASNAGTVQAGRQLAKLPPAALAQLGGGGGHVPPAGRGRLASEEPPFDLSMLHGERSAMLLERDLTSDLQDVARRITRLPDDIYKQVSSVAAKRLAIEGHALTPAQAMAQAWQVFVQSGVTGFTDKGGRNWQLSSYVEMAVRTVTNRAYNASHMARMQAVGVRLFVVPDDGRPCPLCFPWQGKVLSTVPNRDADATIDDATAAGLFHPNCKHTLAPFFPGITARPEASEWTDDDQAQYDATQRQRALEREIRTQKVKAANAVDPATQAKAKADLRATQKALADHLTATGLLRRPKRETPNLGMSNTNPMPYTGAGTLTYEQVTGTASEAANRAEAQAAARAAAGVL